MDKQNNNTDDFQFDDLNAYTPEYSAEEKHEEADPVLLQEDSLMGNPVLRNALIAVMVAIVAMASYKIYHWMHKPKVVAAPAQPLTPMMPLHKPVESQVPKMQAIVKPASLPVIQPDVDKKLVQLASNQQSIQSNIAVVESQISNMSGSFVQLNQNIAALTESLQVLNHKIDQQNQALQLLEERTKPKPIIKPKIVHPVKQKKKAAVVVYHIQALIPGRAWLMGSDGSTITVRIGSTLAGYGKVKMIDPQQGQIMTASGRIIRFSPADS